MIWDEDIVTKNITLYDRFLSGKGEFNKYLTEVRLIADTNKQGDSLDRARAHYEPCQSLIEDEIKLVRKIGKKRVLIIEDGEEMRFTKSCQKMGKEVLDIKV